jgi:regulator of replication initiation timing
MSEFCVKCSEYEGNMELLLKQHYNEMQSMKQKLQDLQETNDKLRNENDALIMDVAFYGGGLINLSCNNK